MEEEKLIRGMFAAIDGGDVAALPGFFHPLVRYERSGRGPLDGLAALLEFYRRDRGIRSSTHHIRRVVADAEAGACWGRVEGAFVHGAPLDELFADTYEFADGRIIWRRTHFFRPAA